MELGPCAHVLYVVTAMGDAHRLSIKRLNTVAACILA